MMSTRKPDDVADRTLTPRPPLPQAGEGETETELERGRETVGKSRTGESFWESLGWMGICEGALRVFRLAGTVILARLLVPEAFGLVALALTVHELVFVLARNGLSVRIIQCRERELHGVIHVAYRANFVAACGLFALQCVVAAPVAGHFEQAELVPMLAWLALVHLIAPWSLIPFSLLQRERRLKELAVANTITVGLDHALAVILAILGAGAWALILPKVLVAPVWTVLLRRARPYDISLDRCAAKPWKETFFFGLPLLATEIVKAARRHLDYLIVGTFLGVEALGLYFFAFNAGLGISSALIQAFSTAVLPHLCAEEKTAASDVDTPLALLHRGYRRLFLVALPLVALQCAAAPIYVPWLFGAQWRDAVPVLILVCLSALPRLLEEGSSQMLRARGLPNLDFFWNLLFSIAVLAAVRLGVTAGLIGVGWSLLISYSVALPLVALWVARMSSSRLIPSKGDSPWRSDLPKEKRRAEPARPLAQAAVAIPCSPSSSRASTARRPWKRL